MFKSQCGTDQISAAILSEPGSGVIHARNAYFLTYRLADLGCSSNIETFAGQISGGQRSMAKISVVNGRWLLKSGTEWNGSAY